MPQPSSQTKIFRTCALAQTGCLRLFGGRSALHGLGLAAAALVGATHAHAGDGSTPPGQDPIWTLLFVSAWVTALNPCGAGSAWRGAALCSVVGGAAGAYFANATAPWIAGTSLFCVALTSLRVANGFLTLLLLTSLGYRRKFEVEDPVACSGVQGTLGGGGYRHTGISLRGERAARSWS